MEFLALPQLVTFVRRLYGNGVMVNWQTNETRVNLLLIALQKHGAAPNDTLEFSNALCARGERHAILISQGNEMRSAFGTNDHRVVISIPTFASSAQSFVFWTATIVRPIRLAWAVVRMRPTRVFSTHFHPWLIVLPLLRMALGFAWDAGVHENPFSEKERGSRFLVLLERTFLRWANRVFCYSVFVRDALAKNLPRKQVIALPLGPYWTAMRSISANAFVPNPRPVFLMIGRIEPYKGVEVFVEAVGLLRERNVQLDAIVAGRGSVSTEMQGIMRTDQIRLDQRWLTQEEVAAMVASADVLIVPYLAASQSGVISLALAAGKPVIASRAGGLSEQVEHEVSGLLVEPSNAHELSEAMERLANDAELRASLATATRELARTRWSWDRAVEIFLNV